METFDVVLLRYLDGRPSGAAKEMAERLGVAQSAVSRWRTGDQIPDDDRAYELGRILGYDETEILESMALSRAARQADRVERIQAARRAAIEQEISRSRSRR